MCGFESMCVVSVCSLPFYKAHWACSLFTVSVSPVCVCCLYVHVILLLNFLKTNAGKTFFFVFLLNPASTPNKINCMSANIQNLNTVDPFADAFRGDEGGTQDGLIHIRIQQRNGRKTLTTVQGIAESYDKKKIVKACKKEFACNGTVVEHSEYGEVIQLQGDQRNNICQFLTKIGIAKSDQLKVHGF